jgi:hypothetical protein
VSERPELRVTVTADDQTVELTDNAAALVLLALANAEALNAIDVFKAVAHFAVGKAHLEFRHSTPATGS